MDGVYLVVRNSYTSSSAAQEAARRLQVCNVNILGVVYNRADASVDYYSRYSQEYYYEARKTGGFAGRLPG
jgi:Mrp family chromosome partitioning ATPase